MPLYLQYPDWIKPEIIPGVSILRWYGLMYIIAFLITYLLFSYQVKKDNLDIDKEKIANLFMATIIGLLIGGRLFSVIFYDPSGKYLRAPWRIILPFDENWNFTGLLGMSFHGGLVGGIAGALIYARKHKLDILEWGDLIIAGVPLGYTFGRLGNFINQELYGRVTDWSIGMLFPNSELLPANEAWVQDMAERSGITIPEGANSIQLPRHPSQLYEAFLEGIVLWLVMWFIFRKRKPFKGFLIGVYIIGYGIARFIAEYFRQPDQGLGFIIQLGPKNQPIQQLLSPLNFTMGQLLSFLMIILGIITLIVLKRHHNNQPSVETYTSEQNLEKKKNRRKIRKKLK